MSEHLNSEEEDLLQSALSTAFSPAPLPRQSVAPESAPEASSQPENIPDPMPQPPAPPEPSTSAGEPESADTVWKEEYEAHVAEWRRQSAEQREKAERTRAEWEAVREQERKEGKTSQSLFSESRSGWESLGGSIATSSAVHVEASPVDGRDLVSGEAQGGHTKEFAQTVLPGPSSTAKPSATEHVTPPSNPDSDPDSNKQDKWDSMTSSLTSSFPSMSFPSDPHSPVASSARRDLPHGAHGHGHEHSHDAMHGHHPHHHSHHGHLHAHAPAPRTATVSVFDSSLSPKTRALALLSSVAINVLLPFVNGVMLGFGEIFAKNVLVRWIGFKIPGLASGTGSSGAGSTASRVGLGKK